MGYISVTLGLLIFAGAGYYIWRTQRKAKNYITTIRKSGRRMAKRVNNSDSNNVFTITAHSGCDGTAPGSLDSIDRGIQSGAQIVEVDVRVRDEDGVPVLAHDLKEKAHPTAVTLMEALERVKSSSRAAGAGDSVRVNLDLKEFDRVCAVREVVETCGMTGRVFFTGVGEEDLARVTEAAPDVRLYVNVSKPGITTADDEEFCRRLDRLLEHRLLIGINTHHKNVSLGYVEFWHAHGYEVSVFTINESLTALRAIALGVDNVTTKTPTAVIEAVSALEQGRE